MIWVGPKGRSTTGHLFQYARDDRSEGFKGVLFRQSRLVGWLELGPSKLAILAAGQKLLINQTLAYAVELVGRGHGANTAGELMEGDLEVPLQIGENSLATPIKIPTTVTSA